MSHSRQASDTPVLSTATPWGHVVGVGALLTIVLVVPAWAEPFTMPKVLALAATALACLPLIWIRGRALFTERVPLGLLVGFVAFAVLSQLASGAPWASGLWGDWARRAGTLTTLALAILFLAGSLLSRAEVRTTLTWIVWAGVPATAYGLIQLVARDPFTWSDSEALVSTFGNANFAAAGLAILGLVTLGLAFAGGFPLGWRMAMTVLAALEFLLALQTGSAQAVFAIVVGALGGGVAWLMRSSGGRRTWALISTAAVSVLGLGLTVLAFLGMGPLVPFISQDTLIYRQWYWGAAVEMAISHPLFGVGPDGYGRFYGEYRSLDAASVPTLGTSAAHNVPLQWASTIGVPAALLYVALMMSVAVIVLRRLWIQGPDASLLAVPVLAAWSAYQVQSLVSIDAMPLALLGWLCTGLLLAVTRSESVTRATPTSAWLGSAALATLGIAIWLPALLSSQASSTVVRGTTEADVLEAVALVEGPLLPCEPSVRVSEWMIKVAPSELTVNAVFASAGSDNRCYGMVNAATGLALQLNEVERATAFANQGVSIDPLNYSTWLLLARAQAAGGDLDGATRSLDRARQLAPQAQEEINGVAAEIELSL